jgi:non-ribosomal peptide synthetase component E (peptide arylation enzyme)
MSENLSKSHLSYARGSTDTSLLTICIGQALEDAAALYGNDEALVSCHQNIRLTYREFNSQVDKIAAGLVALGLKKATVLVYGLPTMSNGFSRNLQPPKRD